MYSFVHIGFVNSICSDFSPPLLPCFLSTRPTDTLRSLFTYLVLHEFFILFYLKTWNLVWFLTVVALVFVLGLGRWCRRIVGVYASAPALVFFNLIFIWAVYIFIVRQGDCIFTFSLFHYSFIIFWGFGFWIVEAKFLSCLWAISLLSL